MFISGLDQTVVVTVLPQVITDLHLPITRLDDASWIVTAYLLGYTAALPLLGRAADVYGYRALLAVCCVLFAAGSWWAAVADGLWSLVAARAVQAVGGGGMVPIALAAAAWLYGGRARVLGLGIVAGAAEAGAVLGPLYGAGVLDALSWRWVFWINLPLAALVLVLVLALGAAGPRAAERLDWVGALLAGVALLALTLGLSGERLGDRPLLLAVAAVLAMGFVLWERRARAPLLPIALFRRRAFASPTAANLFIGAALVVALVEVPLFAVLVLDRTPTSGALTLLRFTAMIPVGALSGGWLAARLPSALVSAGGMIASAAGFLRLSEWNAGIGEPALSLDLALAGLGFGIVLAPLARSALAAAGRGSEATGAATLTIARMVGMTAGLAALTTWGVDAFNRRTSGYALPLREEGQSESVYRVLVDQYRENVTGAATWVFNRLFLVGALLCLLAGLACAGVKASQNDRNPRATQSPS